MKRKVNKNNKLKLLQEDVNIMKLDINMIKSYLNNENSVKINACMNMLEKYIGFKGDVDEFVKVLEENYEEVGESPATGQEKQAEGSGTPASGSKDS